jgi:ubiquitin-conjugating enzyme E2 D/E
VTCQNLLLLLLLLLQLAIAIKDRYAVLAKVCDKPTNRVCFCYLCCSREEEK